MSDCDNCIYLDQDDNGEYCQDKELQKHNAFLVERGLAEDYIKWKGAVL